MGEKVATHGHGRTSWCDRNALYLDFDDGYMIIGIQTLRTVY